MNPRRLRLAPYAAAAALALLGCQEGSAPPGPDAAVVRPPTASATPPTASATPAGKPAAAKSGAAWLVVSRAGAELGILELRPGKRGVLTLEGDSDDARALQKVWTELDDPDGIALEMHLPPESGQGRGAYGARIFKPGEDGYADAVTQKLLAARLDVDRVPALGAAARSTSIRMLKIARSGTPVGTLDFSTDPPTLSIEPANVDGTFLKSHWEEIEKKERVRVRFHEPVGGVETLVSVEAKRGDAGYPDAVRLHLILNRQYDEQRRYTISIVP